MGILSGVIRRATEQPRYNGGQVHFVLSTCEPIHIFSWGTQVGLAFVSIPYSVLANAPENTFHEYR